MAFQGPVSLKRPKIPPEAAFWSKYSGDGAVQEAPECFELGSRDADDGMATGVGEADPPVGSAWGLAMALIS